MEFEIQNKVVVTPMEVILRRIRNQLTNGKLQIIEKQNKDNIKITCPVHKDGLERHPSCNIFANRNDPVTQYGMCHCFACGYSAPLDVFVNSCFDKEGDFGKQWLLDNCDTAFLSEVEYLPEIVVESTKKSEIDVMPEESLHKYAYYHEYMWKRKLTKEIVDLFEVGYDPERDTLVFPVRDEFGRLRFITRRSVSKHFFMIPEDVDKPVYLLYYILQHHIESIAVCESQINALHMWSCGIPAVALFGTGSSKQLETLLKSGIRTFNLYFDGDSAGRKGAYRFKKFMPDHILVNDFLLPEGKDVNDLTKEEIYSLRCI